MPHDSEPIERLEFEVRALVAEHPPAWRDENKLVVYEVGSPPGSEHGGRLGYSRWREMRLPETVDPTAGARVAEGRTDVYDYVPVLVGGDAVEWHVNFADPRLFVAYAGSLFAQDEMQVAEHPVLGALVEALRGGGHRAMTKDDGRPTPVLIMGVERRCRVATDRNAAEGRPYGLYGNAFARASKEAVRRATTRIDPPTITNLIAMAAPSGGYGPYTEHEIEYVLATAYTGFRAAVLESARARGGPCRVAVHSGFWGCGAFGGNRVLMLALQIVAAGMAGLDRLVLHTVSPEGSRPLADALHFVTQDLAREGGWTPADVVARIAAAGFEWGVSDGN